VALLLAVSTTFTVVAITVPVVVVVALIVCAIPLACTGWLDLTALKEVKGTVLEAGIIGLLPPPPPHAVSQMPLHITTTSRQYMAENPLFFFVFA
jgi:hypothetical protein